MHRVNKTHFIQCCHYLHIVTCCFLRVSCNTVCAFRTTVWNPETEMHWTHLKFTQHHTEFFRMFRKHHWFEYIPASVHENNKIIGLVYIYRKLADTSTHLLHNISITMKECTMGDFTFCTSLSLSPKTNLTQSFGLSPKFGLAERKLVLK